MKKLLCIMLALVMVFALVACGDKADDNKDTNAAANTIKIGAIGPTTGGAAVYGTAVKQGMEIAVAEINALGGDIQLEMNFQDDEHDAEKSVNAYKNLKDWGMQLLIGTVTSTPCIAVAAETAADGIFALTPSASSTDVTKDNDNVFQICFTDPNQGIAAADYINTNALGTKIAIIYNSSDAYSTGIYNAFVAKAGELAMSIVYEGSFTEDSATDFSVQLTAAKDAGADLLFLPIYYTPASLILAQADAMDYKPVFFGVDGMDGILTMEGVNVELTKDVLLLTPFNAWSENEKVAAFVAAYEAAYNETPNQFAADGYDCVYAVYNAILANGEITSETSAADVCTAMVATFTGDFTYDGLTGTGMTWSTEGEVSKTPVVCKIAVEEVDGAMTGYYLDL